MRILVNEIKESPKKNKKGETYWWVAVEGQEKELYCPDIKGATAGSEVEGKVDFKGDLGFLEIESIVSAEPKKDTYGATDKDALIVRQVAVKSVCQLFTGVGYKSPSEITEIASVLAEWMLNGDMPIEDTDVEPF